jgi:hypothetical protein
MKSYHPKHSGFTFTFLMITGGMIVVIGYQLLSIGGAVVENSRHTYHLSVDEQLTEMMNLNLSILNDPNVPLLSDIALQAAQDYKGLSHRRCENAAQEERVSSGDMEQYLLECDARATTKLHTVLKMRGLQ